MFDCILPCARKGSEPCHPNKPKAFQADRDGVEDALPFQRSALLPQGSGLRRDRTVGFMRSRAAVVFKPSRRRAPSGSCSPSKASVDDAAVGEIASIHGEASRVHTSLASKLAQHNGLRQFGVDFSHRAPPLELRMLLPELESSIDVLLERLRSLDRRLSAGTLASAFHEPSGKLHDEHPRKSNLDSLEFSLPTWNSGMASAHSVHRLREGLQIYLAQNRREAEVAYEQQRQHLRELAAASPLLSPMISPDLGKRLAEAMRSPSIRCRSPSSSSSVPSTALPSPELSSSAPPCGAQVRTSLKSPQIAVSSGASSSMSVHPRIEDLPMTMLDEMFPSDEEDEGAARVDKASDKQRKPFLGLLGPSFGAASAAAARGSSSDRAVQKPQTSSPVGAGSSSREGLFERPQASSPSVVGSSSTALSFDRPQASNPTVLGSDSKALAFDRLTASRPNVVGSSSKALAFEFPQASSPTAVGSSSKTLSFERPRASSPTAVGSSSKELMFERPVASNPTTVGSCSNERAFERPRE